MDFKKRPTYNSGNLELVSDRNISNGYCGLDSNARVAAVRLASNTTAGLGQQVLADNQTFVTHIPAIQLKATTANATSTVLTTDGMAASSTNQAILPNDTTTTFRGMIAARNTGLDTDSMGFEFAGVIRRGTNAASTFLGPPIKTTLGSDGSTWTFELTADITNGGLKVSVIGEVGKTIIWACSIQYIGVTG